MDNQKKILGSAGRLKGMGADRMRRFRAFSLLELLIVIAIIVVLGALIFPTFRSIRGTAQKARSLNNLQQIGAALTTFVGENNGYIMPRTYAAGAVPAGQNRYWTATLYNSGYLTDKRSFYDPRFAPYAPDSKTTGKQIENGTPETYGMRDWVKSGETVGSLTVRVAKPVAVIEKPSDFFIVADSYWDAWGTQGYGISPGEASQNRVRLNEKGVAGALFLDGHVEEKLGEYFQSLGDHQGQYSDGQPFTTWSPPSASK